MNIINTLQTYKEYAEEQGLTVYAIGLKGSQNYNLADEESDIDANLVFIPTLQQLRSGKTYHYKFPTGEVTCHNIYSFAEIVAKGNPQWIEVCNSDWQIGDFSPFKEYIVNPSALKGMFMEKVHSFSKMYPSRRKYVEKFGYDPKQLHHLIRLYDMLNNNVKSFKYSSTKREYMMDIKRGRYPNSLEDAIKIRDEYIDKLSKIYQEIKENYEPQIVDMDKIDKIVMSYYLKKNKG